MTPTKTDYAKWIASLNFTHAMTFNFNRDQSIASAQRAFKDFSAKLDSTLLGGNWSRKPTARRIEGILVPEQGPIAGRLHYHGAILVPKEHHPRVIAAAKSTWKSIVSSGSLDVQLATDRAGWSRYITKYLNESQADQIVILSQFHR